MKEAMKLLDKALDFNKPSGVMFFIDKKKSFITDGHILLYGAVANYIIKYNEKTFKIPSALFNNINNSKKPEDKRFKIDGKEFKKDVYLPDIQDIRDKKIENSIQFTGLYYHNDKFNAKVFINKDTKQVGFIKEKYYNLIEEVLKQGVEIKIDGQMIKIWDTTKDKSFELYIMGIRPDSYDIQSDYDLLSIALSSKETGQGKPEEPETESNETEQQKACAKDNLPDDYNIDNAVSGSEKIIIPEGENITIETDDPKGQVDSGDDFIEDEGIKIAGGWAKATIAKHKKQVELNQYNDKAIAEQVAVESIRAIIDEVIQA